MLKKAFTLIEMIVVLSIIIILMLMTAPSVLGYMESAEQNVRTETAKTIYLTAQNQLTQLRALGNLKSAYNDELSGKYFVQDPLTGDFTDELNTEDAVYNLNNVYNALVNGADNYYPTADIENGQEGYVRYISKPAGLDENSIVHQFLQPAIVDEDILQGAILIEYNVLTGKILSVFYSDLENAPEFNYTSQDGSNEDIYGERAELYNETANDRSQGYYGVDYTGSDAPETVAQLAIHLYDGYNDGHDDSIVSDISRYNKPLNSVKDSSSETLENVLYAEIFVEKTLLDSTIDYEFDLSITQLGVVINDIVLADFTTTNETFEDALNLYNNDTADERTALFYRNDSLTGDPDFARFIWVLDYAGGDMSSENADRHMYSISQLQNFDGSATLNLENLTGITATIGINDATGNVTMPFTSNEKNPLFADNTDSLTSNPTLANIATARHLNNIRYQYAFADDTYIYTQIEDIDLASENGIIEINSSFANDAGTDNEWNLKLSPLPELHGTYTGEYSKVEGANTLTGAYTIQNLFVYNVNKDTSDAGDTTGAINHSVGLFEKIASTGEISHLMIIDPYVEVKNTAQHWTYGDDEGKYAGVVTGYCEGFINNIIVMSNSGVSPVYDLDDGTNHNSDYLVITNDYVGGVVGMVGSSIAENAIHHVLYLAVAPSEQMGSSANNRISYDYPIIGTNLTVGSTNATEIAAADLVKHAIDDDSCYYLVGEILRPYDNDPDDNAATPAPDKTNMNEGTVTNGFGKGISTNELYEQMEDVTSDFYINFMQSDVGGTPTTQYGFVAEITNPLTVGTTTDDQGYVSSLGYPYPYFGNTLPNFDAINPSDFFKNLNFAWPVASLEEFKAEFVYYEVYGHKTDLSQTKIGIYQINPETGDEIVVSNPLIDTDVQTDYRILTDGYAIRFNRPYSLLEFEDFTLTINDIEIDESSVGNWLSKYSLNYYTEDFSAYFREDADSTEVETIMPIKNGTFQNAVNSATYNDTTDVLKVGITSGTQISYAYINPLFAKAIYATDATDAEGMTYKVRSARHLNNIGYYANSESVNSDFIQELNIDLSNFGDSISRNVDDWSYSIADPRLIYNMLRHGGDPYGTGSGLQRSSGSVASINYPLLGTYNGNGKTISNLVKSANSSNVALFNTIGKDGVVQNLTLSAFDMNIQGYAIGATLVVTNNGTVENIVVDNSNVLGTHWDHATGRNRPTTVGGVVAENAGLVNNVIITNSTVERHEVTTPPDYNLRSYGVGGLIGSNSGIITNSGAVNTTVTAYDNFIGGLVGIVTGIESLIEDCYFAYNKVNDTGLPITPISYDTSVTLESSNPTLRNSIGGIVGGVVYQEFIASGNYVEDVGTIKDTLFLAVAPTGDTDGDDIADTSYPIVGSFAEGFTTFENNVYLQGEYYSNDNATWQDIDYNTLQPKKPLTASATSLLGLPTENLNTAWLETYASGQLNGWTTKVINGITNVYPTPLNSLAVITSPFTANRPTQNVPFSSGSGTVEIADNFTATLQFDGQATNFVSPSASIPVTLTITNTSADDLALSGLSQLNITLGSYANYVDTAALAAADAVSVSVNGAAAAPITPTYNATDNILTIDTTALSAQTLAQNQSVVFSFNLTAVDKFTSDISTGDISTLYYHIAMQAAIEVDRAGVKTPATLTSDKLYIQPSTTIASVINNGAEVTNTKDTELTIPVVTTIATANAVGYTQNGSLMQVIPNGFTVDETNVMLSVDSALAVALVKDTDYTITDNAGESVLSIPNLAPTTQLVLSYNLKYTGDGGSFALQTKYSNNTFKGPLFVVHNAFNNVGAFNIQVLPTTFSLLQNPASLPQSSTGASSDESSSSSTSGSAGSSSDESGSSSTSGSAGAGSDDSSSSSTSGSAGSSSDDSSSSSTSGSAGGEGSKESE